MYDFFDREHANNYLVGTIVRHADKPTLIHAVEYVGRTKKLRLIHSYLRDMEQDAKANLVEEFNFKPVKLGMYNFTAGGEIVEAAWLQRYPARRWKIGLDRQGICVIPCRQAEDNMIFDVLRRDKRGEDRPWYANEDMANMLEGHYPPLQQALAMIGKRTRCSIAFSPNFAVTGTKKLKYRHNDQPVGKVVEGIPTLNLEYQDLQEILQEDLR